MAGAGSQQKAERRTHFDAEQMRRRSPKRSRLSSRARASERANMMLLIEGKQALQASNKVFKANKTSFASEQAKQAEKQEEATTSHQQQRKLLGNSVKMILPVLLLVQVEGTYQ